MVGSRFSAAQERALVAGVRGGADGAVDRLVEAFTPFVASIARRFANVRVSFEDLLQEGVIELLRALERFDETRGNRFTTFAFPSIEKAVKRAARAGHVVSVPVREAEEIARVVAVGDRLRRELGQEPSIEVIAEELGIDALRVEELARVAEGALQLDAAAGEGFVAEDLVDDFDVAYSRREVEQLLKHYAVLRSAVDGSRREASGGAGRAGAVFHLRLLDLERGLVRLPDAEFAALDLRRLRGRSTRDIAVELGASERTARDRSSQGLSRLVSFLNGEWDGPRRRALNHALDATPLQALRNCVARYRQVFEQIVDGLQRDEIADDVEVAWIPGKAGCVPIVTPQARRSAEARGAEIRRLTEMLEGSARSQG